MDVKHYGERPDHSSLAFELASKEFAACGNWTRQEAVEQLNENKKFQRILKIEPQISEIISEALKVRANQGYRRDVEYSRFKAKISKLVGYETEKDELRDSDSYNIILKVVVDLLPPDALDLYPNGLSDESLELDL